MTMHLRARGESRASHRDRRGARIARRDEREYWAYSTGEQRREAGCIAGRMQRNFHHGRLGLLLCVCLLVASPSLGQEISYGGLLGSSLGTLTRSDDFLEPRSKGGFVAGGLVDVALNDFFSVQPQLLFVQKGAKVREEGLEGTITLDYIEVQILGVISFPRQGPVIPFVYAGPSIGANTTATVELNSVKEDIPDEAIKSNDIGVAIGGGVYVDGLTLEARYTAGIDSIAPGVDARKIRAFYVIAGFRFPLR